MLKGMLRSFFLPCHCSTIYEKQISVLCNAPLLAEILDVTGEANSEGLEITHP